MGHKATYAVQQGTQLFDDVVGESDERRRHIEVKRLGGREVEYEAKERGLLEWQIDRFRPFENAIDKRGSSHASGYDGLKVAQVAGAHKLPRHATGPETRASASMVWREWQGSDGGA